MTTLTTLHSQLDEFAKTLLRQDSDVADDVLAVRYDLENAIQSTKPADEATHLDTAHETITLALKMESISSLTEPQKEKLEEIQTEINKKRP